MNDNVILITSSVLGDSGPLELRQNMMKMFLYSLCALDKLPSHIILYTDGVKLAVTEQQELDHLKELANRKVNVLVCGACLKYFGLENEIKVGNITNMYEIVSLFNTHNVIRP